MAWNLFERIINAIAPGKQSQQVSDRSQSWEQPEQQIESDTQQQPQAEQQIESDTQQQPQPEQQSSPICEKTTVSQQDDRRKPR